MKPAMPFIGCGGLEPLQARRRQAQVSRRLYAQVFASYSFTGSLGRAKSEDPARILTALLSGLD
jgi:hypothetical protein